MLLPRGPVLSWLPLAVVSAVLLGGCASPKLQWEAPADPLQRAQAAGLVATEQEELETHTHAHLDVFLNGEHVLVPAGIGIDTHAQGVQENPTNIFPGKQYRVTACSVACLSPLHTHDPSGTIHTESNGPPPVVFSLGQFFTEWGVKLDSSCVGEFCAPATNIGVYVAGKRFSGNPAEIDLTANTEIAVVIGTPPSAIPSTWAFQLGE